MTSPSASSRDLPSTNHNHRHNHHQQQQPPSWIPAPSHCPQPNHPSHPSSTLPSPSLHSPTQPSLPSPSLPSHPTRSHPGPYYQAPTTNVLPGGPHPGSGSSQKYRGVVHGIKGSRRDQRLSVSTETHTRTHLQDQGCAGRVDRDSLSTESVLEESIVDPISDPRRRMRRRELSQFSPEEADRILRRRERNKVAATKCRHKRHAQHEHLVKELQGMECENTSLTYEIRQLQRQRQALSDVLRHHQMSCSSQHQFNLADIPADSKMPPGALSGPYPLPYTR